MTRGPIPVEAQSPLLQAHPKYNRSNGWSVFEPPESLRYIRVYHPEVGSRKLSYPYFVAACKLGRVPAKRNGPSPKPFDQLTKSGQYQRGRNERRH